MHWLQQVYSFSYYLLSFGWRLGTPEESSGRNSDCEQNFIPTERIDWTQWGGPTRDPSESKGWPVLACRWPPKLWSRALGDGYSGIAVEGATLLYRHRRGAQDVIIAINANTGTILWEYAYDADFKNSFSEKWSGALCDASSHR
jgi:hypothetical protein